MPLWLAGTRIARRPRASTAILGAVLVFVAGDLYRFKFAYLADRSEVIRPASAFVTRAAPLVYPARRDRKLQAAMPANPRLLVALGFLAVLQQQMQGRFAPGAKYWTMARSFSPTKRARHPAWIRG